MKCLVSILFLFAFFVVAGCVASAKELQRPNVDPSAQKMDFDPCESFDSKRYYQSVNVSTKKSARRTIHLALVRGLASYHSAPASRDELEFVVAEADAPVSSEEGSGKIVNGIFMGRSYRFLEDRYQRGGGLKNKWELHRLWPLIVDFESGAYVGLALCDAHNTFPADWDVSQTRGATVFDEFYDGNPEVDDLREFRPVFSRGTSNWWDPQPHKIFGRWEMCTRSRGNVARALLYMDIRYEGGKYSDAQKLEPDLRLTDDLSQIYAQWGKDHGDFDFFGAQYFGKLSVLLRWHCEDPVDKAERYRNNVVFHHQGVRNPFVDNPEWVARVFE